MFTLYKTLSSKLENYFEYFNPDVFYFITKSHLKLVMLKFSLNYLANIFFRLFHFQFVLEFLLVPITWIFWNIFFFSLPKKALMTEKAINRQRSSVNEIFNRNDLSVCRENAFIASQLQLRLCFLTRDRFIVVGRA